MSGEYSSAIEYANSLSDDELFSSVDNPTNLTLELTHGELRYIQGLAKEKGMSIKRYMEWEISKRYYEFHMDKGRVSPPMTPTLVESE